MKQAIIILFFMALPAALYADTFDQYAPYKTRTVSEYYSAKLNNDLCKLYGSDIYDHNSCLTKQGRWLSNPIGNQKIDISWDSSANIEEHEIKHNCNAGYSFVWLNAYRNDELGYRFRVETTQAFYIDLNSGDTFDITAGGSCGTDGQPYALLNVNAGFPYKIQVWGNIYPHNGATPGKRFFWEHQITPNVPNVKNPFWQGPGSNRRDVIQQAESWWDSAPCPLDDDGGIIGETDSLGNGCWALGNGDMGANNEPSGANVSYGREQTIAKDTGYNWTQTRYYPDGDTKEMGIRKVTLLGDANNDNKVDITDVVQTINLVLTGSSPTAGSDCNIDDIMTISDVICTINATLTNSN